MLKTVSTQLALASDTLPEVLAKGNTTGGADLAVSSGDDITLADNSKVIFGAGSDLSIYSDGATGQVTGSVNVTGAGAFGSEIKVTGGALPGATAGLFTVSGLSTGKLTGSGASKASSITTYYDDTYIEIVAGVSAGYMSGISLGGRGYAGTGADAITLSPRGVPALTLAGATGAATFAGTVASAGLTSSGQIATNVGAAVTSFSSTCGAGDQTATNLRLQSGRADVFYHMQAFSANTTEAFRIEASGNVKNTNNSYGALSDEKLKENISDASPKLDDLMQVRVRNYNLIGETQKQIGVVAQELELVFPSIVDETEDRDVDGNFLGTTTKGVKYSVFVPMLIKGMQEQQAIIEALTARIEALETLN